MLKFVADNVVHETVTILAFTDEMFTKEHVTIDALLQLKFMKLAVSPDTEDNETLLNLHVCILALLEKIFVSEHVVIHPLAVEMFVGRNDPADKFVQETVTILAFTPEIFTNEHVTIDALLQDKF